MTQREIFEKVKCNISCSAFGFCNGSENCSKYKEYLESLNEKMLEALKAIRKSALQYDCLQCPNDIHDKAHCGGCVMYIEDIILQVEGKDKEEE